MHGKVILGALGVSGAIIAIGQLSLSNASSRDLGTGPAPSPFGTAAGRADVQPVGAQPDVIIWTISGTVTYSDGLYRAYGFGTTSCNEGNAPLAWNGSTNQHPVIGLNLFRLAPGQNGHARFEQLGQGWLKHGFCALDQNTCGTCQGTGCSSLGIGCSDPYSASRNASQGPAGPKYQVNATTGFFPYPPANPSYSGNTARRLRALLSEVNNDLNPGATWWAEAQYIHFQDSPHINLALASNNVSYRQTLMDNSGLPTLFGSTIRREPAINRWKVVDPQVTLTNVNVPNEGRIVVASRAYDNGDGTWDYEYAVYNMNLDRAIGSVTVPTVDGSTSSALGFRLVEFHSGELWTNGAWTSNVAPTSVSWTTPQTYAQNQNSSAIRWGSMFNYRFTSDAAPISSTVSLGVFKPGSPTSLAAAAVVPGKLPTPPCPEDLDGNGTVDFNDVLQLLAAWGPCPGCPEDIDTSGTVDFNDLLALLATWGDC